MKSTESLRLILSLMNDVIKCLLDVRDRALYDLFSKGLVGQNIFQVLVTWIVGLPQQELNLSHVARAFELCASHTDGI